MKWDQEYFDRVVKDTLARIEPALKELEREQIERERRVWQWVLGNGHPMRHGLQTSFTRRGA